MSPSHDELLIDRAEREQQRKDTFSNCVLFAIIKFVTITRRIDTSFVGTESRQEDK